MVGARLLAGRSFRSSDDPRSVAIIDEDMARHLWPDGDAVGGRFRTGPQAEWRTVVGVMADMQLARRDDAWGDFEMLELLGPGAVQGEITLAVRTDGDPTVLFPAIRAGVREVAPDQPVRELTTAEAAYGEALQLPRFLTVLVTAVAAFALVLAAIGLFEVLAYEVAARRRELGIRTSMGATAGELRRMVLRDGVVLAAAGAALGLAGSLALGRFVDGLLYDLEPGDPATLAAVVATMLLTAAIASYLPARRATRVDPAEVLRVE